jgi:hypothetical protein
MEKVSYVLKWTEREKKRLKDLIVSIDNIKELFKILYVGWIT